MLRTMDSSLSMPDPLALWLGTHAWQIFLAALPLLALVVGALAVAWRHASRPIREAEEPDLRWLIAALLLGFGVVVAAGAAFAEIADALGDGHVLGHWDDSFSAAVATQTPPAVHKTFAVLTRFADPLPMVILGFVVAVLLWRKRHRVYAAGWVMALGGNALLNHSLKLIFERARPVHESGIVAATGYSFPSGHSSGAVVAYGMLAFLACRLLPPAWHIPAVVAAALLSVTAACSRVFVLVHFPSDVLAGMLSGSAWLIVCILAVTAARHHGRVRAGRAARAADRR